MVTMERLRRPLSERMTLTEPAGGLTAAMLDLHLAAAAHLDLRAADLGDRLLELAGHRPALSVDRTARRVRARQGRARLGLPHPPDVDVTLNDRVEWSLDVRASGMSGWLDLRRLRLGALQLRATGARVRADLPAPAGPVQVRVAGRGVHAHLVVPAGAVIRFWSEDGWEIDGRREHGPLPHDRYDVWLDGRARAGSRAARPWPGPCCGWSDRPQTRTLRTTCSGSRPLRRSAPISWYASTKRIVPDAERSTIECVNA